MVRDRLFLIDSLGFIFRAYHGRARRGAPPMRTTTDQSTEAIYIFNNMLPKLTKSFSPPCIAAIFRKLRADHSLAGIAEYKANRVEWYHFRSDSDRF
jgi:DNA polymerase-1